MKKEPKLQKICLDKKGERMTLKESYRYANCLNTMLRTALNFLSNKGFITDTSVEHLCSKANPDSVDFTEEKPKAFDVAFTPMQVLDFTVKVMDEQERLAKAIAEAKSKAELDIDSSISLNKKKQEVANILTIMASLKSKENKGYANGYKLDVEGKQTSYRYDTIETTIIDFDRNQVKGLIKKLRHECDIVSETIDRLEVTIDVPFNCTWDINDTFEDAVLS